MNPFFEPSLALLWCSPFAILHISDSLLKPFKHLHTLSESWFSLEVTTLSAALSKEGCSVPCSPCTLEYGSRVPLLLCLLVKPPFYPTPLLPVIISNILGHPSSSRKTKAPCALVFSSTLSPATAQHSITKPERCLTFCQLMPP